MIVRSQASERTSSDGGSHPGKVRIIKVLMIPSAADSGRYAEEESGDCKVTG